MLTLLRYLFRRVSPVMIIRKTEESMPLFGPRALQWQSETFYYVKMLPWWWPLRWRTLREVSGAQRPAKFRKLKHARSAAHELQIGLRTLDNQTIVEIHPGGF